jgi:hypothetical protein
MNVFACALQSWQERGKRERRQICLVQSLLCLPDDGLFRSNLYVPNRNKERWIGKEENETGVVSFQRGVLSSFGPSVYMNMSCLFWVMCLVCIQFSDCVGRHTQLIWTLGVQEFVLFGLGDLLAMFLDCI